MKLISLATTATVALFGIGGGAALADLVIYDANAAFVAVETGSAPESNLLGIMEKQERSAN